MMTLFSKILYDLTRFCVSLNLSFIKCMFENELKKSKEKIHLGSIGIMKGKLDQKYMRDESISTDDFLSDSLWVPAG